MNKLHDFFVAAVANRLPSRIGPPRPRVRVVQSFAETAIREPRAPRAASESNARMTAAAAKRARRAQRNLAQRVMP